MTERAALLAAGRVGRPHGLDGSFHVTGAAPELLRPGRAVVVGDEPTEILARKGTDAQPILRVGLAADRTSAAALRGRELRVPREQAPALGEGEYWAEDLVGCRVLAGDRDLGTVVAMLAYPSCELLALAGGALVPLVGDAIVSIDLGDQRIEVDAGFLGL